MVNRLLLLLKIGILDHSNLFISFYKGESKG